ncbi:unnamed protein product, partial [Orchesella dallaii]
VRVRGKLLDGNESLLITCRIPESTVASGVLFANKIFGSIFDCHPPSSFPLDGYQLQLPGFLLFPSKRLSSTLLAVLAAARKISKYQG